MVSMMNGSKRRGQPDSKSILNWIKIALVTGILIILAATLYYVDGDAGVDQKPKGVVVKSVTESADIGDDEGEDLRDTAEPPPPDSSNDELPDYIKERCIFNDDEEWWPSDWRTRAPAFLLIGAKKAGTSSLHSYLTNNVNVIGATKKELLYFIPKRFSHWKNGKVGGKVLVKEAREGLYSSDDMFHVDTIQKDERLITFEATPDYLFYSTYSTQAILCTMPWVKILVILRNPVDRIFSHYNFERDVRYNPKAHLLTTPFGKAFQEDLTMLEAFNVVPANLTTLEAYFGSDEEAKYWQTYQTNLRTRDKLIARSFYALQLEEWFDALRSIGRDPTTEVMIVQEEELKANASLVVNKINKWLGLPKSTIKKEKRVMGTVYTETMKKSVKMRLEAFFEPYNMRLYKLLGKEWEGIWDWSEKDWKADEKKKAKDTRTLPKKLPERYNFKHVPVDWEATDKPFVERFCDLGSEPSWIPDDDDAKRSWMKRTPFFMALGAKKAGTSSYWKFLGQHPLIQKARSKELHIFSPRHFGQWKGNETNIGTKVRIDVARNDIYNNSQIKTERHFRTDKLKENESLVTMEMTPDYLIHSTFASQAILCTVPWAKVLVSLRNPIDRLFSHFNFLLDPSLVPLSYVKQRPGGPNQTFEAWLSQDMKIMRKYRIVQDEIPQDEYFGSEAERLAWMEYQLAPTYSKAEGAKAVPNVIDRPIARSMYAIQLEEWSEWLRMAGRDPATDMKVVTQEELKENATKVLNEIVEWLGLPPHDFDIRPEKSMMVTKYTSNKMKPETREWLQEFFDPYNKRLYKLLGKEWEGIWDA